MSSFPPRPGTVAYRVLAHLETLLPRRPRATAGMLAGELRGLTPQQVRDALEAAHEAGYVNREAEIGASGRGPVFYELVRNTQGELAVGGADPRAPAASPAAAETADDVFLTGTGAPAHPGGVIEPVVPADPLDPAVPDGAPVLERHADAFSSKPISKVVQIRPTGDGFEVEVERTPELADWLRSTAAPVPLSEPPAPDAEPVAALPPVTASLDFAPGSDQFAVALASDGRLHCWRGVVPYVFSREEARALVDYLNRIDLAPLLEGDQ